MRTTEAKDSACLGPYDNDEKLKFGDTQHMMFRENDLGPFWLAAKKLEIKNDQGKKYLISSVSTMILPTRGNEIELQHGE